jgi:hypothetical protein
LIKVHAHALAAVEDSPQLMLGDAMALEIVNLGRGGTRLCHRGIDAEMP